MRRNPLPFIFVFTLLISGQSSLAIDPIPSTPELELVFGIEEEFRSLSILSSYIGGRVVGGAFPWIIGVPDLAIITPITNWAGGHVASQYVASSKVRGLNRRIFELCENHPTLNCLDMKNGKIIFTDKSGEMIGWVKPTTDMAVVEVIANPFKLKELDEGMGRALQLSLFEAPKKNGLYHNITGGEGHIHIDFKTLFQKGTLEAPEWDYRFFRNYIVDWVNHNELYWGALHYDPLDIAAKPLLRDEKTRNAFKNWLKMYDDVLSRGEMTEEKLAGFLKKLDQDCKFTKGYALNVMPRTGIEIPKTIEIRSLRTKKTMKQMVNTLSLLQGRANFIHQQEGLIPFYDARAIQNTQEGVDRFHRYVQESKIDYEELKTLMPKSWQKKTPRDLPDSELFKTGNLKPGRAFRCWNWMQIHVLGR